MNRARTITITVAAGLLAVGLFAYALHSARQEEAAIRARYQQMRNALSAGEVAIARSLFAPEFSDRAFDQFDMLGRFAKPLSSQSRIRIQGSQARVCPEPIYHYRFIPGGHTIEMVKVDGEWFFTGDVNID